jgi:hypothetical protein
LSFEKNVISSLETQKSCSPKDELIFWRAGFSQKILFLSFEKQKSCSQKDEWIFLKARTYFFAHQQHFPGSKNLRRDDKLEFSFLDDSIVINPVSRSGGLIVNQLLWMCPERHVRF